MRYRCFDILDPNGSSILGPAFDRGSEGNTENGCFCLLIRNYLVEVHHSHPARWELQKALQMVTVYTPETLALLRSLPVHYGEDTLLCGSFTVKPVDEN